MDPRIRDGFENLEKIYPCTREWNQKERVLRRHCARRKWGEENDPQRKSKGTRSASAR
jgi:hypothetical protein